jgi:hypothetical protein
MNTTKTITSTTEKQLKNEKDQAMSANQYLVRNANRTGKRRFNLLKHYKGLINVSSLK